MRVISKGPCFEGLLAESFDQVRSNAKGNVAIMLRMIEAFQTIEADPALCAGEEKAT